MMFRMMMVVVALLTFVSTVHAQVNETNQARQITHTELDQIFIGPISANLPDSSQTVPGAQYMASPITQVARPTRHTMNTHRFLSPIRVAKTHRHHRTARADKSTASVSHRHVGHAVHHQTIVAAQSTHQNHLAPVTQLRNRNPINRMAGLLTPRPISTQIASADIVAIPRADFNGMKTRIFKAEQALATERDKNAALETANQMVLAENHALSASSGKAQGAGVVQAIGAWVNNNVPSIGTLVVTLGIMIALVMAFYLWATTTGLSGSSALQAVCFPNRQKSKHGHDQGASPMSAVAQPLSQAPTVPPPAAHNSAPRNDPMQGESSRLGKRSMREVRLKPPIINGAMAQKTPASSHNTNQRELTDLLSHQFEDGRTVDAGVKISKNMTPISIEQRAA